jgi:hypothetical protein
LRNSCFSSKDNSLIKTYRTALSPNTWLESNVGHDFYKFLIAYA